MPVNKIDYSKTIIYRIVCKDTNITDCYIGQTTDLRSRKSQHKSICNNENSKSYNYYVYQIIRNNGGFENWDIIEVEKYNAIDSNDSLKRERYWIEFYKANLNIVKPTRTKQEFYEDNKEQFLERAKHYRENNKEQITIYKKQHYKDNKQMITKYYKQWKEHNKESLTKYGKTYYIDNREKVIDYQKQYYNNNKQDILEKMKETVTCECGYIITNCNLTRHKKSKKHLNAINNI